MNSAAYLPPAYSPSAYPYAPLASRLIRRADSGWELPATWDRTPASTFGDDLRFFAASWAAGFLFFLAYLA